MTYRPDAEDPEPSVDAVRAMPGEVLLEFGAAWCPHCQRAQGPLREALGERPGMVHLKIEDGRGRPLGRAFRVKLWPTLVRLVDGEEVARVVRPVDREGVEAVWGEGGG